MAVSEKVDILQGHWTGDDALFLSGWLNDKELSVLASLVSLGHRQLWKIIDRDKHVASFITRLDKGWDDKVCFDICHVGGHFTPYLKQIDELAERLAKMNHCAMIRVYCGREELANRLIQKQGCRLYETIVCREVL